MSPVMLTKASMPALRSLKAARGETRNTSSTSGARVGEVTSCSAFVAHCSLGSAAGTGGGGGDGTALEPLPLPLPASGSGVKGRGCCSASAIPWDVEFWMGRSARQIGKKDDVTEDQKVASARMLGYPRWLESLSRGSGASSESGAAMLSQSAREAPRFCVSCSAATLVSWSRVSVVSDSLVMLQDRRTQCPSVVEVGLARVNRGGSKGRWSRAQGNGSVPGCRDF
jgi:hypothetical protein